MDDYEAFCITDPNFYDAPGVVEPAETFLASVGRSLPAGWHATSMGSWTVVHHDRTDLPAQGWKIHVSACPSNARRVLVRTWDHCIAEGLAFKFLATPAAFMAQNAKYADRSGSGKFVTIYPADDAQLARTLHDLDDQLRGEPGPYILSDLRWNDGPLYVRYGGFASRECPDAGGSMVPAIEDPDGRLVPDERLPAFRPPAWAPVPVALGPAIVRRDAETAEPFSFDVRDALHFSNGGGVYLAAAQPSGETVVLKEARPWAGLDGAGTDAVARLAHEHAMLERLAGLECVPQVHDRRTVWEHEFLIEEHIEGATITEELARRHPLVSAEPEPDAIAAYTAWALAVLDEVERAVAAVHDRGIVIADLHPRNIIVRPDGAVVLVDFELAHDVGDVWNRALGASGFAAPEHVRGFDVDRYALGALRLSLFLPYTDLIERDPDKLDELLDAIEERFPVPPSFARAVRADLREIVSADDPEPGWRDHIWPRRGLPDWPRLRGSMIEAILASATPERTDRLFPGDPVQFSGAAVGMANGAAGVLWALHEVGADIDPAHLDWLTERGRDDDHGPGFGDGAAGIALALATCGCTADAVALADATLARPMPLDDPSLHGGLAGIGLSLLALDEILGEPRFRDVAGKLADAGAALLDRGEGPDRVAGLVRGWSGLALLALRLHDVTGDENLLDTAERALRADLDRCRWAGSSLQYDDDWRTLPYLDVGSAGVGIVLAELSARRPDLDPDLVRMQDGIRVAATGDLVIQSGLWNGRAGLLLYLCHLDPVPVDAVLAHVRALAWHAVPYEGRVAFVGDHLARLSMDLATGAAGVLLAMAAVFDDEPVGLPFLRSPRPRFFHPTIVERR